MGGVVKKRRRRGCIKREVGCFNVKQDFDCEATLTELDLVSLPLEDINYLIALVRFISIMLDMTLLTRRTRRSGKSSPWSRASTAPTIHFFSSSTTISSTIYVSSLIHVMHIPFKVYLLLPKF